MPETEIGINDNGNGDGNDNDNDNDNDNRTKYIYYGDPGSTQYCCSIFTVVLLVLGNIVVGTLCLVYGTLTISCCTVSGSCTVAAGGIIALLTIRTIYQFVSKELTTTITGMARLMIIYTIIVALAITSIVMCNNCDRNVRDSNITAIVFNSLSLVTNLYYIISMSVAGQTHMTIAYSSNE
jgi:hypothetical protein